MFNSKNFNPNAGSNVPKILNPGTHYCRIADLKFDAPPYDPAAYFLVLTLEGVDRGDDFAGIAKDKQNPSLGNYRGQIANVRSGRYPFSTYTYDGRVIQRDEQIFRWVNNLAKQMGVLDRMNAEGVQAETIEEYVDAVRSYLVNEELWGHFTLAGQEYFTEGYDKPNYRMFFPKQEGKNFPYAALEGPDGQPVNFLTFDKAKHIIVKKEEGEAVASFGGQTNDMFNLPGATAAAPAATPVYGPATAAPAPAAPATPDDLTLPF